MSFQNRLLYIENQLMDPIETDPFFSMLVENGYSVTVAKTGDDAWEKLDGGEFECIILDIMIPHGGGHIDPSVASFRTGIAILEAIRNGEFPKNVAKPIIVASAIADLNDKRKIKDEMKVDTYLEKPFRPAELEEVVRTVLEKKQ